MGASALPWKETDQSPSCAGNAAVASASGRRIVPASRADSRRSAGIPLLLDDIDALQCMCNELGKEDLVLPDADVAEQQEAGRRALLHHLLVVQVHLQWKIHFLWIHRLAAPFFVWVPASLAPL